jgi:capsular polysaccharide export protein
MEFMKILIINPKSRARNKYFKSLEKNIDMECIVRETPLSLNIFSLPKNLNYQELLKTKFFEIDTKYKNRFISFLYKLFLRIEAPLIAAGYYKTISSDHNLIGLWNGKKYPQNIAVLICKQLNKQTFFFENGCMPNTTTVDFQGVNATASIPRESEFYRNYISKKALPTKLLNRKEESKRIKTNLELPKNYIFVPFQVGYDSQIIYHSPWIRTMEALYDIVDTLSQELKVHFVLKEHPSDKTNNYSSLHQRADKNPYLSFANNIETQELIEKSMAVVTINSSVGIEALLFHKKVVVLGEAFYLIDKITKGASSLAQLKEILIQLEQWTIDKELTNSFLSYINEEYLVPKSWESPDKEHFLSIENKIRAHFERS